ncbi:hypothetical protein SAMN05216353_102209 [Halobacillus alkaliphilus]|uniref:Uncharacterized protein n=1 Tax=Halobacillus alkaliphilus TaxID=396056 RepID=A0A1I2K1A2_9BACI|nr:hypothetical protein [Halobacillus alkaliphilus]SFF58871.1 hypothetical protein SAMN05216353_102209 [Halobacillus alkaliphilus]
MRTLLVFVVLLSYLMLDSQITGFIHTYITSNRFITGVIYSLGGGGVVWIALLILGKVMSLINRE